MNLSQRNPNLTTQIIRKCKMFDSSLLFQKVFCRPLQISLKTWETENNPQKVGKLPYGLKQAIRRDIQGNKYILANFDSLQNYSGLYTEQNIASNNYDNFLSLIKPKTGDSFEIAICVAMYSETKSELKRTLEGIAQNVEELINKGFQPHKIAVVVIMDGIEASHSSVGEYLVELQKENFIFLDEPYRQKDQTQFTEDIGEEEDLHNLNSILYSEDEYADLVKRRFINRKKEYQEVKSMIRKIEQQEKDTTTIFQSLNEWCVEYFIEEAKKLHTKLFAETKEEVNRRPKHYYIEEYSHHDESKQLIKRALVQAKKGCHDYLESRNSLALMYGFRKKLKTTYSPEFFQSNEDTATQADQNQIIRILQGEDLEEKNVQEENGSSKIKNHFMNLFIVAKYKNQGKLSSHNWFFNGFCQELNPKYAVLIDVGLRPEKNSITRMIQVMEKQNEIGGVCGYMSIRIEKIESEDQAYLENVDLFSKFISNFVSIQHAQQMQYHYGHIIDKPFESIFNFIHVLPGAFSAYRMEALFPKDQTQSKLLNEYFKSIMEVTDEFDIKSTQLSPCDAILRVFFPEFIYNFFFRSKGIKEQKTQEELLYNANINLAEDRTLCMGIHQNGYKLRYLPDAYAWVDPIKTVHELFGQRKRWNNGSWFAFDKVKRTLTEEENCSVTWFFLSFQILFLAFNSILAWFSPVVYMLTIHLSVQSLTAGKVQEPYQQILITLADFSFSFFLIIFMMLSIYLNNKHKFMVSIIYFFSTLMGIMSIMIFIVLGQDIVRQVQKAMDSNEGSIFGKELWELEKVFQSLPWLTVGMIGLFILPMLLHSILFNRLGLIFQVIRSCVSFLFYSPTFLMLMTIYSISRIDDISWGTKGRDSDEISKEEESKRNLWRKLKMLFAGKFLLWNYFFSLLIIYISDGEKVSKYILILLILIILLFSLLLRVILGVIYLLRYKVMNCSCGSTQIKNATQSDKLSFLFRKLIGSIEKNIEKKFKQYQDMADKKDIPVVKMLSQIQIPLNDPRKIKKFQKLKFQSRVQSSLKENFNNTRFQYVSKRNFNISHENRQSDQNLEVIREENTHDFMRLEELDIENDDF